MRTTSLSPRFMMTLLATGVALALAAPVSAAPARTLAGTDWADDAPVRAPAANSASYTDSTGDGGAGPDLTNITVSSDDAGNITFRVDIPNRPTLPATLYAEVEIDADSNAATGEPESGGDYFFVSDGPRYGLARWNGSAWEGVPHPASLNASYSGGITFTINAGDLGGTTGFRFWVGVSEDPASTTFSDVAPEFGLYTYSLARTPAVVDAALPGAGLVPRAGKVFSARAIRLELDNGDVVAPDERTCTLKIAGKVVKPLAGGCKWRIPAAAVGKRAVLQVTLGYGEEQISKTFRLKIKQP
jgi:hypothetical protein